MDGFLKILDSLAKYTPLAVAFFSFINLVIAIKVFKINHNNSVPKISITAIQKKVDPTDPVHYSNWIGDNNVYYDDFTNEYRFGSKGFPRSDFTHENLEWYLAVSNNSDLPATNIEVKFKIIIEGFSFNIQEGTIPSLIDSEKKNIEILVEERIEYLAARETKNLFISNLYGAFRSADLVLLKLKGSERTYIKKPTKIDNYNHLKMNMHNNPFEMVNIYASLGFDDSDMREYLNPEEYLYFLETIKRNEDD